MSEEKTANVNARIDQNDKSQNEAILTRIGLPARNEMTDVAFNRMMATGLKQAKANDSFDLDKVFDELEAKLEE